MNSPRCPELSKFLSKIFFPGILGNIPLPMLVIFRFRDWVLCSLRLLQLSSPALRRGEDSKKGFEEVESLGNNRDPTMCLFLSFFFVFVLGYNVNSVIYSNGFSFFTCLFTVSTLKDRSLCCATRCPLLQGPIL